MPIVTNNPRVLSLYPGVRWVSGGPLEVLVESRRMVHEGYSLLSHPFLGDIHLLGNPFRTVILADQKGDVHLTSLRWVEECIEKIHSVSPRPKGVESLEDYQAIDLELVRAVNGVI
jgi:hypothetical protein